MNLFNIERAYKQKKDRGWDKVYWSIDLHDVIIQGKYNRFNVGAEIYPFAQQVLQFLYRKPDTVLILWTSSHDDAIKEVTDRLKYTYGVEFHYINENPECGNTELCNFKNKYYFNILLDDKAGFEGETDWELIKEELIRIGEWPDITRVQPRFIVGKTEEELEKDHKGFREKVARAYKALTGKEY